MNTMNTKNNPLVKGLRMLRTANILYIISVVLTIVGLVALLVGAAVGAELTTDNGGTITAGAMGAMGAAGIGTLVAVVGLVLVLIATIMELVGLVKTTSFHANYKTAMIVVVVGFLVTTFVGFVSLPTIFEGILNSLTPVITFLVIYFVISGTTELLQSNGSQEMAASGIKVRSTYLVCTVIMVVAEIAAFLPALASVVGLITVITAVVQLVALFRYIGFLGKAAAALEA